MNWRCFIPWAIKRCCVVSLYLALCFTSGCGTEDKESANTPESDGQVNQPEQVQEVAASLPSPVLVKAGGVIRMLSAEELEVAERKMYAAPAEGELRMLQNLYEGVQVAVPAQLYEHIESVLEELRETLSPSDYAQLLEQVQYWWDIGRHSEYAEIKTPTDLRNKLKELAQSPEGTGHFTFARVLNQQDEGIHFRTLVRYWNGQMHYADDRVFVSLRDQDRFTSRDQLWATNGLPYLNQVWDTRTEELLLCTSHRYMVYPVKVETEKYVMVPYDYMSGQKPYDSQLNIKEKIVTPVFEWQQYVKNLVEEANQENTPDSRKIGVSSLEKDKALASASAASEIGVVVRTLYDEDEGVKSPHHQKKILNTVGVGAELRIQTCWGDVGIIDLGTLRSRKVARDELETFPLSAVDMWKWEDTSRYACRNEDLEEYKNELKLLAYSTESQCSPYAENSDIIKRAIKWPIKLDTKVRLPGNDNARQVVLSEWSAGTGSNDTIVFTAFACNCFDGDIKETTNGKSVYTGVWHKGKTWILAVDKGIERECLSTSGDELMGFHESLKGRGSLISLDEVARQKTRSANLLSSDDCVLMVTEPDGTDECTYLLIGGTRNVNRLRVNFNTREVEYLESWEVQGADLNTAWLEDLRMLLLPASDNHFNMIQMNPDGSSEEVGQLYVTESDGYAVVLKDGLYAGTPGCEEFLNYCDGRQVMNMKALAPWRNRPAEVLQVLGGKEEDIAALRATTRRWLQKLGHDADNMPAEPKLGEFPVAEVELPGLFTEEDSLEVKLKLRATARDLSRVEVLRDGVRIPQPHIEESDAPGEREVTIKVPLASGQNWIEVTPVDVAGIAGETKRFRVVRKGGDQGALYVVALGVADYDDDSLDLQYAAKDAKDMAAAWSACSGMQTHTLVLTDKEVKDASVLKKIEEFLSDSTLNDKVVFYLAGHGMLDGDMEYYYAPAAFDTERIAETGISSGAIMDCMDAVTAQTKVLLLDTCHAGMLGEEGEEKIAANMGRLPHGVRAIQHRGMKVQMTVMSYANQKRYVEELFSAATTRRGINMMSASAGAEYALETSDVENGVFTASIIEALREPAWRDGDLNGILSVDELFSAVLETVAKRTAGMQTPSITMMENRGSNEIVYHPGYYILQNDWSMVEKMLADGVRLIDAEETRKTRPFDYVELEVTGNMLLSRADFYRQFSWLFKMLDGYPPVKVVTLMRKYAGKWGGRRDFHDERQDTVFAREILQKDGYTQQEKLQILKVLLNLGADAKELLLEEELNKDVVMLLQELGVDVNERDSVGNGVDVNEGDSVKQIVLEDASISAMRNTLQQNTHDGDETAGLSAAQVRELGVDYAEARKGKAKNEQRAIQLYIKAAHMGDMKAQRWMGWRYRQGLGVPKDEQKARAYFSAAARQGDTAAAAALRQ